MGNNPSIQTEQARQELFLRIYDKLKTQDPKVIKQFGGIYLFCLMKKQTVKYWTVDMNKVSIYPGEPEDDQEPDATVTLTEDMFEQMAKGKITPRAAIQAGKCSVNGDIMKVMKMEPYLKW